MKYELSDITCMSIKEMPSESRPREKLEKLGTSALSDIELLCAIIGAGTRNNPVQEISQRILEEIIKRNGQFTPEDLSGIPGLGKAKACSICASIELGRRLYPARKKKTAEPKDIYNTLRHYGDMDQEHFICVMLNGALEILGVRVITIGLVNRALVHPREIFREAVQMNATAIIVAHNHPSGNLEPSEEDLDVTQRIKNAGNILGIRLLDHIIFSSENYLSLRESNDFWF